MLQYNYKLGVVIAFRFILYFYKFIYFLNIVYTVLLYYKIFDMPINS